MRLAAIDLDGTLLRSDGTISQRSRAAIRAVRDAGIVVVIVTARGPASIARARAGRRHRRLGDLQQRRPDRRSRDRARSCASGCSRRRRRDPARPRRCASAFPGIVFAVEHEAFAHEPGFAAWGWEPPPGTRVADALELLGDPATKLILRHAGHEVEVVAASRASSPATAPTVVQSGGEAVEVTAVGVNKAAGLAEVADEHGIDAVDVIAFGDYPNDVPMLAWAGRGVAVANAHAEVLAIADEVTASNDDDGVAIVLEQLAR